MTLIYIVTSVWKFHEKSESTMPGKNYMLLNIKGLKEKATTPSVILLTYIITTFFYIDLTLIQGEVSDSPT